MPQRKHNFSAGPGALPEDVLLEVRNELPVYDDIGSSVLEISHRSRTYGEIAESARSRLRKLLGLSEHWHILFLQGGASMQFYQVPLNFLPAGGVADYLDTGAWASKAIEAALPLGDARCAASSKDRNYAYIPDPESWKLTPEAAYLHYTSNNTIYGTQFKDEPDVEATLVCDASSDFLSRPLHMDRYGLIYAGAQKNIGPSGVTVVLIHNDFLGRANPDLPVILDYRTHAGKLYNTPAVFAVYVMEKVLRWLEGKGGIEGVQKINAAKARRLYGRLDSSDFYRGTTDVDSRSEMNVCFRLADQSLEADFIAQAADAGLLALKGHRSVGGMRASLYNAVSLDSVNALVSFMDDFEQRKG